MVYSASEFGSLWFITTIIKISLIFSGSWKLFTLQKIFLVVCNVACPHCEQEACILLSQQISLYFLKNERVFLQTKSVYFTDEAKLPEYHHRDSLNTGTGIKLLDTGLSALSQLLSSGVWMIAVITDGRLTLARQRWVTGFDHGTWNEP